MTALLVSVRNAVEAEDAVAGGAAIIDVKEPANGSMGRPDPRTVAEVVRRVAGRRLVSAALGEFSFFRGTAIDPGLKLVKMGLAKSIHRNWAVELARLRPSIEDAATARFVAVAYADWQRAEAPRPDDLLQYAIEHRFAAFLIDTWGKDGSTLLDWIDAEAIADICRRCRESGVPIALAGSLGTAQIRRLLPARPDWFAVRGAACAGGRSGVVERHRVAELASLCGSETAPK